jgi:hypothetical protein
MVAASCEVPVRSQGNYKPNLLTQVSIQVIQTSESFLTFHVQSATQVLLAQERVRHFTRLLAEPKYFGAHVTLTQPIRSRAIPPLTTEAIKLCVDTTTINRKRESISSALISQSGTSLLTVPQTNASQLERVADWKIGTLVEVSDTAVEYLQATFRPLLLQRAKHGCIFC